VSTSIETQTRVLTAGGGRLNTPPSVKTSNLLA